MKWEDYVNTFEEILEGTITDGPYKDVVYVEYTKLNQSRMNRWLKKNVISEETKEAFSALSSPQKWILITEPWCGDAAHNSPIIHLLSELSDQIELEVQLRDTDSLIDDYLTNGGKSIPKLIVRDENDNDLFTWGARPKECQEMVVEMKTMDISAQGKNMKIQQWYNKDKGETIQRELIELMNIQ